MKDGLIRRAVGMLLWARHRDRELMKSARRLKARITMNSRFEDIDAPPRSCM